MPMTITEKILADHLVDGAGQREVHAGALVDCRLDMLMGNDITAPISIKDVARKKGLTPKARA